MNKFLSPTPLSPLTIHAGAEGVLKHSLNIHSLIQMSRAHAEPQSESGRLPESKEVIPGFQVITVSRARIIPSTSKSSLFNCSDKL